MRDVLGRKEDVWQLGSLALNKQLKCWAHPRLRFSVFVKATVRAKVEGAEFARVSVYVDPLLVDKIKSGLAERERNHSLKRVARLLDC